jgi:hypothetical protein
VLEGCCRRRFAAWGEPTNRLVSSKCVEDDSTAGFVPQGAQARIISAFNGGNDIPLREESKLLSLDRPRETSTISLIWRSFPAGESRALFMIRSCRSMQNVRIRCPCPDNTFARQSPERTRVVRHGLAQDIVHFPERRVFPFQLVDAPKPCIHVSDAKAPAPIAADRLASTGGVRGSCRGPS